MQCVDWFHLIDLDDWAMKNDVPASQGPSSPNSKSPKPLSNMGLNICQQQQKIVLKYTSVFAHLFMFSNIFFHYFTM